MGATSKRAKKIRTGGEFDLVKLAAEMRAIRGNSGAIAWDLDAIRAARDEQMAGVFARPARLAEAMRTDYALFAAHLNRLAPQRGLPVALKPANQTARALRVAEEGESLFGPQGVAVHPDTLVDINSQLANHGIAFGVNVFTPRADGSRVDVEHKAWPIEYVYWSPFYRCFMTRTEECGDEPIVHGDGRWTVYRTSELEPWKHGAVLPAALVWAGHAFAVRDLAKASTAHGNAKVVGTMPEGVDASGEHGQAFLELLRGIASVDSPYGIKPFGSAIDFITNNSSAWQVFKEGIDNGDKAAARIYLGQDGTMGTNPTGPGIDARGMFGVRNDIVEGDLRAIERGLLTGVIEPWCAINFGDSTLAPQRVYLMPDADEDTRQEEVAKRNTEFFSIVEQAKRNGFDVTPEYVAQLAESLGVSPPALKASTPIAPVVSQPAESPEALASAPPAQLRRDR